MCVEITKIIESIHNYDDFDDDFDGVSCFTDITNLDIFWDIGELSKIVTLTILIGSSEIFLYTINNDEIFMNETCFYVIQQSY